MKKQPIETNDFVSRKSLSQMIYLDFDGEETSYHNSQLGLHLENVTVENSGFSEEQICCIVSALNEKYSNENIIFVTGRPPEEEYSTIFVGKTDAFDQYGDFLGLAETIDQGNQIQNDNAFVFADDSWDTEKTIAVISHELDHIVSGKEHVISTDSLADFAADYISIDDDFSGSRYYLKSVYSQKYGLETVAQYFEINLLPSQKATVTITLTKVTSGRTTAGCVEMIYQEGSKNARSIYMYDQPAPSYQQTFTVSDYTLIGLQTHVNSASDGVFSLEAYFSITVKYDKKADLSIASLKASQTLLTENKDITLSFSVKNSGVVKAGSSYVYIYDNNSELGTVNISSIEAGTTSSVYTYTIKSGVLTEGKHNLRVVADGNNSIEEFSESNNSASVDVKLATAPDLSIATLAQSATTLTAVHPLTLEFTVKNPGLAAPASFVYIYDGANILGKVRIAELGAETTSEKYTYTINAGGLSVGKHTLKVVADGENTVAESNENNNTFSCEVTIKKPLPDLKIISLTSSVSTVATDETAVLSFTIKNIGEAVSEATHIFIYDGTNKIGDFSLKSLDAGETSQNFSFEIAAGTLALGKHTLKVVADGENTVAESDETNNSSSAELNVILPGIRLYSSGTFVRRADTLDSQILAEGSVETMVVNKGGTAIRTDVRKDGRLKVLDGGKITSTSVLRYGWVYVSSGGYANSTVLNSAGMDVFSGASAENVTLINVGSMWVNGGKVNSSLIDSGSVIIVESGGSASNTCVKSTGYLHVLSSGTANSTTLDEKGSLYVDGGSACNTEIFSGGYMRVYNSGSAKNVIINSGGTLQIHKGGAADGAIVNDKAVMNVFSTSIAKNTVINSGGKCVILNSAAAENTNVNADAMLFVSSGASVHDATVNQNGYMKIFKGGEAAAIRENGGNVVVEDGANVTFVKNSLKDLNLSAVATFHSGTSADGTIVNYGAALYVSSGGAADNTKITSSGYMRVCSGGNAYSPLVESGGKLVVSGSAVLQYAAVRSKGILYLSDEGRALSATVSSQGMISILSGGSADKTSVDKNGCMYVCSGGTANNTVTDLGNIYVYDNGKAVDTTLRNYGRMYVSSGGAVDRSIINSSGWLELSGGVAENTTVNSDGWLVVSKAKAVHTTINFGGIVQIADGSGSADDVTVKGFLDLIGGEANGVNVSSGGWIGLYGGVVKNIILGSKAKLTLGIGNDPEENGPSLAGHIQIDQDALISANPSGLVDFTVSDEEEPNSTPLINDISLIPEGPAYTLTVASDQTSGSYALAGNASGFSQTIRLKRTDGTQLGTIGIGTTVKTETCDYTLSLKDSDLVLAVAQYDTIPPVLTLKGDTETILRSAVLTASTNETSSIFYSLDKKNWTRYTGDIAITCNGTYYFKAKDASGNVDKEEITFTNIDNIPPAAPVISVNITSQTNQDVTISALFSEDSVRKEYSFDNQNWSFYTNGIVFTKNGTVYFRSSDAAGNVSDVTSYSVSNIDKIAPDKPAVSADITSETNQNVTVSALFSTDSVRKEYSFDNQIWSAYTTGIVFSENGSVYFRCADAAGNVSEVTSYTVSNIVKTSPDNPVDPEPVDPEPVDPAPVDPAPTEDTLSAPTGVWADVNKYNVTVTWAKYTVEKGSKVTYRISSDGTLLDSKSNKYTFKNAAVGNHSFSVCAIITGRDGTKTTQWSSPVSVNVADVTAPKAGKITSVSQPNPDMIAVTWQPAADNVGIDHYIVRANGREQTVDGNTNTALFSGLGGKVNIEVYACDAAGLMSKAAKKSYKMQDVTAPSAPTDIVSRGINNKSGGVLAWTASTDNVGVTQYEIRITGVGKVYKSKTPSVKLSKLKAGTYECQVVAFDKARNISDPAAGIFVVADVIAPKIKKLSSSVDYQSALITWNAVDESGSIARAELSIDGGQSVDVSGMTSFEFTGLSLAQHAVELTVWDQTGNFAVKACKVNIKKEDPNLLANAQLA